MKRIFRQGDPLSILFNLIVDVLARMLKMVAKSEFN